MLDAPTPEEDAGFTLEGASDDLKAFMRLAALDPVQYDRVRKDEAKQLGIRPETLDTQVKAHRRPGTETDKQGRSLKLDAPDPWPEPVNGATLLGELAQFFGTHLSLPSGAATVLAGWSIHTHAFGAARHTPRLAITSAEKGSGKTTVLDMLHLVVRKPLSTAHVTPAAVFRVVESANPTLLVDEADTFLHESEELRGVLNAGHKRGGQVLRCVGDEAEPRAFAAFAPAAIAAIGTLPGTLADRSIVIRMKRASRDAQPRPIRDDTEKRGAELARKAARWAEDHDMSLRTAEPKLPNTLVNRAGDNWRALFAITELAGDGWSAKLGQAAALLQAGGDEREGLGVALLRDIRDVFHDKGATRLPTAIIVAELLKLDDRPWPEIPPHGKPLTACKLTRQLKQFEVGRLQWRVEGSYERVWGFDVESFADAWTRYLPVVSPHQTGDCHQFAAE